MGGSTYSPVLFLSKGFGFAFIAEDDVRIGKNFAHCIKKEIDQERSAEIYNVNLYVYICNKEIR